jgi:hypothetical protein
MVWQVSTRFLGGRLARLAQSRGYPSPPRRLARANCAGVNLALRLNRGGLRGKDLSVAGDRSQVAGQQVYAHETLQKNDRNKRIPSTFGGVPTHGSNNLPALLRGHLLLQQPIGCQRRPLHGRTFMDELHGQSDTSIAPPNCRQPHHFLKLFQCYSPHVTPLSSTSNCHEKHNEPSEPPKWTRRCWGASLVSPPTNAFLLTVSLLIAASRSPPLSKRPFRIRNPCLALTKLLLSPLLSFSSPPLKNFCIQVLEGYPR